MNADSSDWDDRVEEDNVDVAVLVKICGNAIGDIVNWAVGLQDVGTHECDDNVDGKWCDEDTIGLIVLDCVETFGAGSVICCWFCCCIWYNFKRFDISWVFCKINAKRILLLSSNLFIWNGVEADVGGKISRKLALGGSDVLSSSKDVFASAIEIW